MDKILWLTSYRDLDEFIERKQNILHTLERHPRISLIVFSGTNKEREMYDELIGAFMEEQKITANVFDSIKKHYEKLVLSLAPEENDLAIAINDCLVEIEWILEDGPQDSEAMVRDQMQSVQLLIGSHIAFSSLNLKDWKWLDARDVFQVEEDYQRTGPKITTTKTDIKTLFEERRNLLPAISQGGLVGTYDNNSLLVDDHQKLIREACRELNVEFIEI